MQGRFPQAARVGVAAARVFAYLVLISLFFRDRPNLTSQPDYELNGRLAAACDLRHSRTAATADAVLGGFKVSLLAGTLCLVLRQP